MTELTAALAANPYPGRVLILARTGDGSLAGVYVLTGRSESSRLRRLVRPSPTELRVEAVGERAHDRLRHYPAAKTNDRWTVFGNGEQVDTVHTRLLTGTPPAVALDDLSYEPDPPIRTPRITAVVDRRTGTAWLGAARRSGGHRESADITVTTVRDLSPGDVVLLSTYRSDGTTVQIADRPLDLTTTAATPLALLSETWSSTQPSYLVAAALLDPLSGTTTAIRHAAP